MAHLCDTDDHVLDHRLDGSETGNVLSVSVPDSEDDLVGLWLLDLRVGSAGVTGGAVLGGMVLGLGWAGMRAGSGL